MLFKNWKHVVKSGLDLSDLSISKWGFERIWVKEGQTWQDWSWEAPDYCWISAFFEVLLGGSGSLGFWGWNLPLDPPKSNSKGWDPSSTRRRCQSGRDGSIPVGVVDSGGSSVWLDSPKQKSTNPKYFWILLYTFLHNLI